jgi:lysophospholipase
MDRTIRQRSRILPKGMKKLDLSTSDGTRLRMMLWRPEGARGSLLLVPGRTEFIERYAEIIADFLDRGLAVAILDLRNHGLSTRPLANRHKHYLRDFAPMVDDLGLFVARAADEGLPRPFHLLGHSMGGHVALRFAHDHPQKIDKLILSAPMVGINFGALPPYLVRFLVQGAMALGRGQSYAPGQSDWRGDAKARAALRDYLTSDAERFADEDWQLEQQPDLKLGGVTWGWMAAALASCDLLQSPGYGEGITVPTAFILAGADRVVDNDAARALARNMPDAHVITIPNARHELMREADPMRDQFLKAVDDFIGN